MKEIYLDQEKKVYYFDDFNKNVLTETDGSWGLSEFIKPHLTLLNSIDKIQPLYSKFPDNINSLSGDESYLTLAYAKEIELILFRVIIQTLVIKYNDIKEEMKFYYIFSSPEDNPLYSPEGTSYLMGCISNPDYFRINHIKFCFQCWDINKHKEFWNDLNSMLQEVAI